MRILVHYVIVGQDGRYWREDSGGGTWVDEKRYATRYEHYEVNSRFAPYKPHDGRWEIADAYVDLKALRDYVVAQRSALYHSERDGSRRLPTQITGDLENLIRDGMAALGLNRSERDSIYPIIQRDEIES